MKKKLALLGILKQDKSLMILDEPYNGLDIETCRIIRSILLRLKDKGKTIIITSHIIETLTNLCDYIHHLENGTIKYIKEKIDFAQFERELFESIENKNLELITELTEQSTNRYQKLYVNWGFNVENKVRKTKLKRDHSNGKCPEPTTAYSS